MPGRHRGEGYDFIHAAVDDRSRLAYAEVLPDERKESASAFMTRAITFFDTGGPDPTDPRPTARSSASTSR